MSLEIDTNYNNYKLSQGQQTTDATAADVGGSIFDDKENVEVKHKISTSSMNRKEKKQFEEFIAGKLAAYLKTHPSATQDAILSYLNSLTDDTDIISQVEKVLDKFIDPSTKGFKQVSSLDDIEELGKTAKKGLRSEEKLSSIEKAIIKVITNDYKADLKNTELNNFENEFNELRKAGKSRSEVIKELRKEFSGKDGNYAEMLELYQENDPSIDRYTVTIRDDVPVMYADSKLTQLLFADARKEYAEEIAKLRTGNGGITSVGELRAAIEKALGNKFDEFSQFIVADDVIDAKCKEAVYFNRSETIKANGLSRDDMKNAVGVHIFSGDFKNNGAFIYEMESNGLISKMANGNYDVTNLSNLIRAKIGADLTGNNQLPEFVAYDEIENILTDITAKSDIKNLSKADVIALMKACGYGYENGYFKALVKNMFGNLVKDGVQGAVTGMVLANTPFEITINTSEDINLLIKLNSDNEYLDASLDIGNLYKQLFTPQVEGGEPLFDPNLLDENGNRVNFIKTVKDENGNVIGWQLRAHKDNQQINRQKVADLGLNVTTTILTYVAMSILKTALDKNRLPEKPIAVTQFATDNYDEYCNIIANDRNMAPQVKSALLTLAKAYVDDSGNWNVEGYKLVLNELAGDRSVLSKKELAAGVDNVMRDIENQLRDTKDPKQKEIADLKKDKEDLTDKVGELTTENEELQEQLNDCAKKKEETPVVKVATRTTETVDARKSGWTRLTQCYECWDGTPNLSDRIRILKLAQGVTDGNYSKERMDKLLELNRKYGSGEKFKQTCKEAGIDFNFDAFNAALKGTALGEVVLPKNFYDCDRTNDTNLAIKVKKDNLGDGKNKYHATKTTQYRVNKDGTNPELIDKDKYDEYLRDGAEKEDW